MKLPSTGTGLLLAGLLGFALGAAFVSNLARVQSQSLDEQSATVRDQYEVIYSLRQKNFELSRGPRANMRLISEEHHPLKHQEKAFEHEAKRFEKLEGRLSIATR